MTEQERKFLTEWWGECRHEWHAPFGFDKSCKVCKKYKREFDYLPYHGSDNRTFTTPTDVQALVDRLKEKELTDKFGTWYVKNGTRMVTGAFTLSDWLECTPEQQCQLIADFLKSLEVE